MKTRPGHLGQFWQAITETWHKEIQYYTQTPRPQLCRFFLVAKAECSGFLGVSRWMNPLPDIALHTLHPPPTPDVDIIIDTFTDHYPGDWARCEDNARSQGQHREEEGRSPSSEVILKSRRWVILMIKFILRPLSLLAQVSQESGFKCGRSEARGDLETLGAVSRLQVKTVHFVWIICVLIWISPDWDFWLEWRHTRRLWTLWLITASLRTSTSLTATQGLSTPSSTFTGQANCISTRTCASSLSRSQSNWEHWDIRKSDLCDGKWEQFSLWFGPWQFSSL